MRVIRILGKIRPRFLICLSNNSLTYSRANYFCSSSRYKNDIKTGPNLKDFIVANSEQPNLDPVRIPYLNNEHFNNKPRKIYFDVYGCQMNVNDTEIVWSILKDKGFVKTEDETEADIFLVMTCAIREGAETKIWHRLNHLKAFKRRRENSYQRNNPVKIGILGCMAERLKTKLIEKERSVDIVAGPDSYRDLPRLLALTENNQTAVNVLLSLDETYADVMPVRLNQDGVTAFVSIMRGCDNMCTYCIVPFTRGRERARPIASILEEIRRLVDDGVKEVTLLGQNVNSYRDTSELTEPVETRTAKGFKTVYKTKKGGLRFADLLDNVSAAHPDLRIRFTSPHPKDFPDEVLHLISERNNICKLLHLPAQSGNSAVLERMRRGYTREAYLELIDHVRDIIPTVGFSSDFICGFCGETEDEFRDTLTLMERVKYTVAYLFPYSMREKTTAHRRFADDVPDETKRERHMRMVEVFRRNAERLNQNEIGKTHLVLVEGRSKKSEHFLAGRNDLNVKVILPQMQVHCYSDAASCRSLRVGDFVAVEITAANSQVLKGTPLFRIGLNEFYSGYNDGFKLEIDRLGTNVN